MKKKKRGGISLFVLRGLGWIKPKPKRTQIKSLGLTVVIAVPILALVLYAAFCLGPYSKIQPDMTLLAAILVVAGLIVAPSVRALRDKNVSPAEAPLLVVAGFVGLALIASILVIGYGVPDRVAGVLISVPFIGIGASLLLFFGLAIYYWLRGEPRGNRR